MAGFDPLSIAQQAGQTGTQKVTGSMQALLGLYEYLNARKQAKNNIKPFYNIDPSFQQNLNSANSYASEGIPQQALDYYTNNANKSLTAGLDTIMQTGQGGNSISSLVDQSQQNEAGVAAADANEKLANVEIARKYNSALGEQRDKQWLINKYSTWADKAAELAAQQDAGMQNLFGGINTLSSAGANNQTSNLYSQKQRPTDYQNPYLSYYQQMNVDNTAPATAPTVNQAFNLGQPANLNNSNTAYNWGYPQ